METVHPPYENLHHSIGAALTRTKLPDQTPSIPSSVDGPLIANLDDDHYSADVEFDPTNESIYESAEDIECRSEDMSLSSGDDSDATNQRGVNYMNIRDLFFNDLEADDMSDTDFDPAAESTAESEEKMSNGPSDEESDTTIKTDPSNMSIRDLFYADFEIDHPSDEDFDPASETTNDSEENMDNSGNSNDADSDYTDDPNATAMTLLDLVRQGDIDDRSSDEEYQPADEGTDDVREDSESDKENSEQEVKVQSFLSDFRSLTFIHEFRLRYLARRRYQSLMDLQNITLILHPSRFTPVPFKIDRHSTKTV